jgi:hypothetical protein
VACSSTTCRRTNKRFDRACQETGIRRKTLWHSGGAPISRYHEYEWFNNTAFFVPSSCLSLLRLYNYENCHVGAEKAFELLSRHFRFPKMRSFVTKYCRCLTCLIHKQPRLVSQVPLHSIPKEERPFEILHCDYFGPLKPSEKFKFVFVIIQNTAC